MRFWRSESDQQTPPTECIGCRATGGRAGIPRCVAESRWGEKRGRPWSSCRRLSRSSWPAMAILTWAGVVVVVVGRRSSASVGCCRCRRKEELPRASMFSLASFPVAPWRRMALTSPQCGALATVHMRLGRPSQPKASTPNSVAVRIHHQFHQHGTEGFFFYSSSPVKHRSYKPSRSSYPEKQSHDTNPPRAGAFLPVNKDERVRGGTMHKDIQLQSSLPTVSSSPPARCTTCRL